MAHDVLRRLVSNSRVALDDGTYDVRHTGLQRSGRDMARDIAESSHAFVISEIKFASPSEGRLRTASDPALIAGQMVQGGARALSVLTQPHLFGGSPEYFAAARRGADVPMIMKDVIIDKRQIDAASLLGADYILLIWAVFESGLGASGPGMLDEFMAYAHHKGLGVVLEVHTPQEYAGALDTTADIIGINNRNLDTLEVDIGVTESILSAYGGKRRRVTLAESGIKSPEDIRYLRKCGADGFLVGSSIMKGRDIKAGVRELADAY